jgi:hypothetical protein
MQMLYKREFDSLTLAITQNKELAECSFLFLFTTFAAFVSNTFAFLTWFIGVL